MDIKMELYQLKYFLYAAKYENISKAAQALRVSQPSISRAVVALENNSTHLVRSLVSDQVGITLWPEYSWGKRPDVHMVRIVEPGFHRSVFLLRQKNGEIPPAAERFVQFVEDYMRTLEHEK